MRMAFRYLCKFMKINGQFISWFLGWNLLLVFQYIWCRVLSCAIYFCYFSNNNSTLLWPKIISTMTSLYNFPIRVNCTLYITVASRFKMDWCVQTQYVIEVDKHLPKFAQFEHSKLRAIEYIAAVYNTSFLSSTFHIDK